MIPAPPLAGRRGRLAVLLLPLALVVLFFLGQLHLAWPRAGDTLGRIVLLQSVLPRAAVALLAGALLGLSGALLQRVLRNPIADPSTLGIVSGAQLALTLATAYAPALLVSARESVTFAGGALTLLLVLVLTWRRGLEPVTVALCGMLIALVCASVSAAVVLANGDYMLSLFIWGGGSLEQLGWEPSIALLWRLVAGLALTALLLRPLALLGLDDNQARALGMNATAMRLLVVVLAVLLATGVVAHVGVIGFVGLAAPHLVRLAGFVSLRSILLVSPAVGALLLALTDGLVQLATFGGAEFLPTGAATALIGGPALLLLLPRLRTAQRPPTAGRAALARRLRHPVPALLVLAALLAAVTLAALFVGRGPEGWDLATGAAFEAVAPWRWPRVLLAASAGAMLAASGFILQRVSGNPLASPEVLGVSSGAGLGLAAVLLLVPDAGRGLQSIGSVCGSLAALSAIVLLALRGGFGAERLLLGGIAIGSLSGALVSSLISRGGLAGFILLEWLTGSTGRFSMWGSVCVGGLALFLVLGGGLFHRWLTVLPLGFAVARSLGLSAGGCSVVLVAVSGILSGLATLTVGPLSFIGLFAPHLVRLAGFSGAVPGFCASVLAGSLLMVLSDWLGRVAFAPYALPVGLVGALVGVPYLVWLLNREGGR